MKRTSKAITLLAALAVSLSLTAGVSAQTTETLPVGVTLEREEAICDISFEVYGTFGSWVWDATAGEYVFDPASNDDYAYSEVTVYGVMNSQPTTGCDITVGFDGLSNDAGDSIGVENFSAVSWWADSQNLPDVDASGWTHTGVTGDIWGDAPPAYDWDLRLESVPTDLQDGTYSGDIDITYSNAQ